MQVVSGTFNATGAALTFCLGFIPDEVYCLNIEDANSVHGEIRWFRDMRTLEAARGVVWATGTTYRAIDMRTVSDGGITVYRGGELLTAALQTSVAFGGVNPYVAVDQRDLKADLSLGVVSAINAWTLGSSANRTGSFNADVLNGCSGIVSSGSGTGRIGEGSKIVIRETNSQVTKETFIHAASNGGADAGGAANEVTLNEAVASGDVVYIGPAVDFAPVAIGARTAMGITLAAVTALNDVAGELCFIKAVKY